MKKLFAVVLALACALSMHTFAFAASRTSAIQVIDTPYFYDRGEMVNASGDYELGKTYYFPVINTDSDYRDGEMNIKSTSALGNFSISKKLHSGSSLFNSAEFVVKNLDDGVEGLDSGSAVFVAVSTSRGTSSKAVDVDWVFTVKSRNEAEIEGGDTLYLRGTFTRSGSSNNSDDDDDDDDYDRDDDVTTIRPDGSDIIFDGTTGKVSISFGSGVEFRGTVSDSQKDLSVEFMDMPLTTASKRIENKYSDANLSFYLFQGKTSERTFSRQGYLYLPADEGSYVYQIENGAIKPIQDASYSRSEGAFLIPTRILESYVVSDRRLSSHDGTSSSSRDESSSEESSSQQTSSSKPASTNQEYNPSTGASSSASLAVAAATVAIVGVSLILARKKK